MNKEPKYSITAEANQTLYKLIKTLSVNLSGYDFGYERKWDENGKWIDDFLTVYRSDRLFTTTMSPEKFEQMDTQGQRDYLTLLMKMVDKESK